MSIEWQECRRDEGVTSGRWAAVYVTLNPQGILMISRRTFERLGSPSAVMLLFDRPNNRIGIKPAVRGTKNSFPVGVKTPNGGRRINAFYLLHEFGVRIKQTVQFHDAEIDPDGILTLDLRSARVSTRSIGYEKSRAKRVLKEQELTRAVAIPEGEG